MFRLLSLSILILSSLSSSDILDYMGNRKSIFLNPADSSTFEGEGFQFDFFNSSISVNSDSMSFLDKLVSLDSSREISKLMKKNISKTLGFDSSNFTSIFNRVGDTTYLFGIYSRVDGYFITHTGFGSKGAMESYIDKINSTVANISTVDGSFRYGLTLKSSERGVANHDYTISEIIENRTILDYLDNGYFERERGISLDIGAIYSDSGDDFSISILDLGDTSFGSLGAIRSTTNIGYSSSYRGTILSMDYLDIFQRDSSSSFKNSFKFTANRSFFSNSLNLYGGIFNQSLSYGIKYSYSIVDLSLSSYKIEEFNGVDSRRYRVAVGVRW